MDKRFKLVLAVSLAFNLLLVGIGIGYQSQGCRHRKHRMRSNDAITKKLPPKKAAHFNQKMEELHKKNRKNARAIRKTRKEIVKLLAAPQFDSNTYFEKSKQLHNLHGQMRSQLDKTIVELANALDQDERQVLARFLEKGPRHRKRRSWGKPRHPKHHLDQINDSQRPNDRHRPPPRHHRDEGDYPPPPR